MDLEKLSNEELNDLINEAKRILKKRLEEKWIHLTTDDCFTPKFGKAYVAKLYLNGDLIEREFITSNGKEWCKKNKSYKESWDIEINEGDVIEARLKTGKKFDKREWWYVENGDLVPLASLDDAKQFLKNLK